MAGFVWLKASCLVLVVEAGFVAQEDIHEGVFELSISALQDSVFIQAFSIETFEESCLERRNSRDLRSRESNTY